jgi:hypothetical protein
VHSLVQMMNVEEVLLPSRYEKRYGGTFVVIGSNEIKAEHLPQVRYLDTGRETGGQMRRPVESRFGQHVGQPKRDAYISASSSIKRVRNRIIC